MSVTSTLRNYISISDLQELASINVTNSDEAMHQIARAEQAIDNYVGYQNKHVDNTFRGMVSSSSPTTMTDTNPASQLHIIDGYFANCVIEILGGTGKGQVRFITDSSYDDRKVTISDPWQTQPDTTSFYRIYQLAKFPRDVDIYSRQDGRHYYKSIPDAVRLAVAAQIEFMIAKGEAWFVGDDSNISSEHIDNYSYTKANAGQSSMVTALAPRARTLLRGYKNSLGTLNAENTTNL